MRLKDKILNLLNEHNDEYISGEYMATAFDVSRNAIWKAINSIRKDGYNIYAVQNRGYILDKCGAFTGEMIKYYLQSPLNVRYFSTVTSTNDIVMDYGSKNMKEGIVVVTNCQTKGKGRRGRVFYSPENIGSYFSILLRPNINFANALYITAAAASAVVESIEALYNIKTYIKWVNDIYYNNKKICGILTEAHTDMESGIIDYIALGIGINIFEPETSYHKDIENIAGATFKHHQFNNKIRCQLTAKILDTFYKYYKNLSNIQFLETYKSRSLLIGKNIYIAKNGIKEKVYLKDIDNKCRLHVIYQNGCEEYFTSGEVSIHYEAR